MAPSKKKSKKTKAGKNLAGYMIVGRITQPVARSISMPAGYIYVNRSNQHLKKHESQTKENGLDLIKHVAANYNQIRQGSEGSLLLVVYSEELSKVIAVQLYTQSESNFYIAKTALVMSKSKLIGKSILWEK